MLNENFVILGAVISGIGSLSYLIDTLKGKVKPNRVTFFLWALAPLIGFAAQINQGVGIQSLLTFMIGFSPALIFLASFLNKKAEWKLHSFDFICGGLSILGLVLWYITKTGIIALSFSMIADALASLPTVIKSYKYPETENPWAYLGSLIAAILTILTITNWNFAHWGFPIQTLVINLVMFVLIQFKWGKRLNYFN